jgi:hypothetical protein
MSNDRFTIKRNTFPFGEVTYWRSGNHYYKHYNGKTTRILKGEYLSAKMEYERGVENG